MVDAEFVITTNFRVPQKKEEEPYEGELIALLISSSSNTFH
jgi:hypothetical protein